MKYLGINKPTFWGSSIVIDIAASSNDGDGDNESVLSSPLPLKHSEESWSSMSYNKKIGFMEHITNRTFHSEHLLPFTHGRY